MFYITLKTKFEPSKFSIKSVEVHSKLISVLHEYSHDTKYAVDFPNYEEDTQDFGRYIRVFTELDVDMEKLLANKRINFVIQDFFSIEDDVTLVRERMIKGYTMNIRDREAVGVKDGPSQIRRAIKRMKTNPEFIEKNELQKKLMAIPDLDSYSDVEISSILRESSEVKAEPFLTHKSKSSGYRHTARIMFKRRLTDVASNGFEFDSFGFSLNSNPSALPSFGRISEAV